MSLRVRTYALDTFHGRPAAGVPVSIESAGAGGWMTVARGVTGDDGSWTGDAGTAPHTAVLRLVVDTGGYYAALGVRASGQELTVGLRLGGGGGGTALVTVLVAPAGGTAHVQFAGPA
ncbi:MAG: 5-hydroxyisourate hydrolase [Micromonosporaceae bacterium]